MSVMVGLEVTKKWGWSELGRRVEGTSGHQRNLMSSIMAKTVLQI